MDGEARQGDNDWLAHQFEAQRPHLQKVAYRMLGSLSDSEDAVQEAWLRVCAPTAAPSTTSAGG